MSQDLSIFRVVHELIEQPSWGGDFITKLKGLDRTPEWSGKKVGQAYELAIGSRVIDSCDRNRARAQSDLYRRPSSRSLALKSFKSMAVRLIF